MVSNVNSATPPASPGFPPASPTNTQMITPNTNNTAASANATTQPNVAAQPNTATTPSSPVSPPANQTANPTNSSPVAAIQISRSNLISPQWLLQTLTANGHTASFHAFPNGCLFIYDTHIIPLHYHPVSNLPIFTISQPSPSPSLTDIHQPPLKTQCLLYSYEASTPTTFRTSPHEYDNLTSTQRHLYNWHVRLGHLNFLAIQAMARKGLLGPRDLSQCHPPLCRECLFGKAKRRSVNSTKTIGDRPLHPGEMCCVDQMVAGCKGLPYTMHGPRPSHQYTICTFFVDVATQHIFAHFQESTNATETVAGKQRYEQYCLKYRRHIQEYRSDNGIFTDRVFTNVIGTAGQIQTVAATGAHHMNGVLASFLTGH